jgi:hypothetical protein
LLIEWPQSDALPAKYWLSNLPEDTSLITLVATAKGRWRIERDYQELKQDWAEALWELEALQEACLTDSGKCLPLFIGRAYHPSNPAMSFLPILP